MSTTDEIPPDAPDEGGQLALDVDELPGGAKGAVEAVLMVVEEPVSEVALASALEVTVETVRDALAEIEAELADGTRGWTIRSVAGGWRLYSHPAYASVVERFVLDGQQARLTQASLETLAVIAYRQPISRARISAVRGVSVDGVVRTLLTRGLITEVSHDGESGSTLYGTTDSFLERMGLQSLDDLPPIAPYLPEADMIDELAEQGRA
ncbi:SMC-Scp complex subunit ScpB [Janibacter melonis]|uniref:SMC-Scp complex subunit ScpB n=1 Tax=Janibacter melonis TaxID=262209 RepID=A0A176QB99_9MICO|nr:SMC-Scp complex subunit ScpB [Janibacter melonis]MBD5831629.1 SMC-Scp complex subunit ScpB [Janibacter melonis]OAB87012.1 segregation and condensation protein B [Janibacter melonis]QFQ30239.1 SMC-Scp complex subunit ScpB [Janibacter melonis]